MFSDTQSISTSDMLLHNPFQYHAFKNPQKIAVESSIKQLTYFELDQLSISLANEMEIRGLTDGSQAAVILPKGWEQIVSVLGISRAGGVYLPIDPEWPRARISELIADAGVDLVVCNDSFDVSGLPENVGCLNIGIISSVAKSRQDTYKQANCLAYTIFTSGSTGKPKGVMISHQGAMNTILDINQRFTVHENDKVLALSALNFDLSVYDIFGTLAAGATIVIPNDDNAREASYLWQLLVKQEITIWNSVPQLMNLLVNYYEANPGLPKLPVRLVLLSGDWIPVKMPERIRKMCREDCEIISLGGATEASIWSILYPIQKVETSWRSIPYGKAMSNQTVQVLDQNLEECGQGEIGDIYIGGMGLALGYLNDEAKTKASFVVQSATGARLYRTGDMGRYLCDGNIEFLGRQDGQIKYRGYRIESGEVESVLAQHPMVKNSVLVMRKNDVEYPQLVSYIVLDKNQDQQNHGTELQHWSDIYDQVYSESHAHDPTFDISGWNSSYSLAPLPESEMKMWLDETVADILELNPERVLEIGCGTGMILFRVAPACQQYCALDVSPVAIERLRRMVTEQNLHQVSLFTGAAHELSTREDFPQQRFDMTVINSVIQHFPNMNYLVAVIEHAVSRTNDGGAVYLGDIRSHTLLNCFHTSVELYQASTDYSAANIRERVQRKVALETDLCVAPEFFSALQRHIPRISGVEIRPKKSAYSNELSCYRYQVVLHINAEVTQLSEEQWRDWNSENMNLHTLEQILKESKDSLLAYRNIPNKRIDQHLQEYDLINTTELTAVEIRNRVACDDDLIELVDLHALARRYQYTLRLYWQEHDARNSLSMVLILQHSALAKWKIVEPFRWSVDSAQGWASYGNQPAITSQNPVTELRQYLQTRLPEYMVPSTLIILEQFPLTANGKLDRSALPAPTDRRIHLTHDYVPANSVLEQQLCEIWSGILGLEPIGVHDSFFELGGDSIASMRVVAQCREIGFNIQSRDVLTSDNIETLAKLIAQQKHLPIEHHHIPVAVDAYSDPFPLTIMQQAYWLGMQRGFEMGGIHARWYLELEYPVLDEQRFVQTWQTVINHFDGLRCVLTADGMQKILPSVDNPVEIVDLSTLPAEQLAQYLEHTRATLKTSEPDPESWPLFTLLLQKLPEGRYRFYFNVSLLICDGWGFRLLVDSFRQVYQNPDVSLPESRTRLRDYVNYLHDHGEGAAYQRARSYWLERLKSLPSAPVLPVHHAPNNAFQLTGREYEIPAAWWQALKSKAARVGITPSILVAGIFTEILGLWCQNKRFCLNVLHFNRYTRYEDSKNLLGNFSTTLLLEVDLTTEDSFEQRISRLQEQFWHDLEHLEFSGVELIRAMNHYHGDTLSAAMPVAFASLIGLTDDDDWGDYLSIVKGGKLLHKSVQTPQVHLDHQVYERSGALVLSADIFEAAFPSGMLDDLFQAYIDTFDYLANHEQAWQSRLVAKAPHAHLQLQRCVNDTTLIVETGLLQSGFEYWVRKAPEQLALISEERQFSYRELDALSAAVAVYLCKMGCQPENVIAVFAAKSCFQIVAVLAVLRAGGAYLPLDPGLPAQRLEYILQDAGADIVLSMAGEQGHDKLPEGCCIIDMDDILAQIVSTDKQQAPEVTIEASALAYVIYTSGTTGNPKGVAISHQAAMNTIADVNRRFQIQAPDRVLALSSLSFDLSVFDMFGMFAVGGAIVVPSERKLLDPDHWLQLIQSHQVSIWNSAPQFMEMFCDYLTSRTLSELPLRRVMLSGDWIPLSLPERIRHYCSDTVKIISLGGATEASIWSCYYEIDEVHPQWQSIPYGKPLANQSLHILNDKMEPCPLWVTGELFIGGRGLALGYLNDVDKTAASFVVTADGERLYRTGDLGCYLSDGNIEFQGRADFQVKFKGYRIEPGEIESVLLRRFDVRQVVVTVAETSSGQSCLAAFIVCDGLDLKNEFDILDLRSQLIHFTRELLPAYMVPERFLFLEHIPSTLNGKVDYKSLRILLEQDRATRTMTTEDKITPRDQLERNLAEIWEEILDCSAVFLHDNFFELGGNSLLAVRLIVNIQQKHGYELTLATLLQFPTLKQLAERLRSASSLQGKEDRIIVPIQIGDPGYIPFFCIHGIGGSALSFHDLGRHISHHPVIGIQALATQLPANRVEQIASRYIKAIREYYSHGAFVLCGWSFGGLVAFEMARQLQSSGLVPMVVLMDTGIRPGDCVQQKSTAGYAEALLQDLSHLQGEKNCEIVSLRAVEEKNVPSTALEIAQDHDWLPREMTLNQFNEVFSVFAAHSQALEHYTQQHVLLQGCEKIPGLKIIKAVDSFIPCHEYQFWTCFQSDESVAHLRGDHYSFLQGENARELAQYLMQEVRHNHAAMAEKE